LYFAIAIVGIINANELTEITLQNTVNVEEGIVCIFRACSLEILLLLFYQNTPTNAFRRRSEVEQPLLADSDSLHTLDSTTT
jgi:hypothetical protein